MAAINRLLKIIGLFCKRALQKRLYSAIETYKIKEPAIVATPYSHFGMSALIRLWVDQYVHTVDIVGCFVCIFVYVWIYDCLSRSGRMHSFSMLTCSSVWVEICLSWAVRTHTQLLCVYMFIRLVDWCICTRVSCIHVCMSELMMCRGMHVNACVCVYLCDACTWRLCACFFMCFFMCVFLYVCVLRVRVCACV